MNKEFFRNEERKKQLYNVLESWKGTPYRHLGKIKGVAVDCIMVVWETMKELGALDAHLPNIPMKRGRIAYPKWASVHSEEEIIFNALRPLPYTVEMKNPKDSDIKTGDICCYRFGKSSGHMGIYYEGYLFHSVSKAPALYIIFTERKFRKRLTSVFRIMEH